MTSTVLYVLVHFAAAGVLAFSVNAISLIPWRRSRDAHWTERARLLWPARASAAQHVVLVPLLLGVAAEFLSPTSDGLWVLNGLSGALGVIVESYFFDREVIRNLTLREWSQQVITGYALQFSMWGLLALFGFLMPIELGWPMAATALTFLVLRLAIAGGAVFPALYWMGILYKPSDRLRRIVGETAQRMGTPIPGVARIRSSYALAYAFPTVGTLAFSERALEICPDREVAAIAAHELAHLREPRLTIVGRLVGALASAPLIVIRPSLHALGPAGVIPPIVMAFAFARLSRWHSLRLERKADATAVGAEIDQGDYARALENIYRENLMPAVNPSADATHPHLYDRMVAAGLTPDYPLPHPPEKLTMFGKLAWGALGAAGSIWVIRMLES